MRIINYLSEYFGDGLLLISSPGIASIINFHNKASTVLKLINDEDDDLDVSLTKVTKKVKKEINDIPTVKLRYKTKMNSDIATDQRNNA